MLVVELEQAFQDNRLWQIKLTQQQDCLALRALALEHVHQRCKTNHVKATLMQALYNVERPISELASLSSSKLRSDTEQWESNEWKREQDEEDSLISL